MNHLPPLSPRATRDMLAMPTLEHVIRKVRGVLTLDLLKPAQRRLRSKLHSQGYEVADSTGHCYVSSEAVWHLMGGRHSKLQPMVASYRYCRIDGTHWWLVNADGKAVDPTADQFLDQTRAKIYRIGRHAAFLTKRPSKRAAEVIRRVRALNRKAKS